VSQITDSVDDIQLSPSSESDMEELRAAMEQIRLGDSGGLPRVLEAAKKFRSSFKVTMGGLKAELQTIRQEAASKIGKGLKLELSQPFSRAIQKYCHYVN